MKNWTIKPLKPRFIPIKDKYGNTIAYGLINLGEPLTKYNQKNATLN